MHETQSSGCDWFQKPKLAKKKRRERKKFLISDKKHFPRLPSRRNTLFFSRINLERIGIQPPGLLWTHRNTKNKSIFWITGSPFWDNVVCVWCQSKHGRQNWKVPILFWFIIVKRQCWKREMVSVPLAGVEQRFMSLSWNSLGSVRLGDLGHTPWFS